MVVRGPLAWQPLPPPPPRRFLRWALSGLALLLVLLASITFTIPYYAIEPGSARQVNDLIDVPEDRAFPPRGKVLLATVALAHVTPFEALRGWLDADIDVVPEKTILGPVRRRRFNQLNLRAMEDSKQTAAVIALRRLGFPVAEEGKGALIEAVEAHSPAGGRLVEGEVITGVDGRSTLLAENALEAIRAKRPGASLRLDVQGVTGAGRVEEIVLGSKSGTKAGFLGVVLRTRERHFDYPFDVTIDSGAIGGPSAGLAFTLGVLDTLTAGELTGGRKVAVTGTIEMDGRVGDVGGVVQKTAAVRSAGARYFLVPPKEFEDAKAHAGPHLTIVKVANLEDALEALARLGGDVTALGRPGAGRSAGARR
ncbi:MAG TPA: S16 family serine protease [Acidimicrobiales bacterium]|nr:S16 family serine protease [Acidimicrobiales bacterium]